MAISYNPEEMGAVWARYLRSWADAIDDGSLEVERGTMERKTAEYLDAQEAEGVVCRVPTGIMTFDATLRWVKEADEFAALMASPGVSPIDPGLLKITRGKWVAVHYGAAEGGDGEGAEDDDEGAE